MLSIDPGKVGIVWAQDSISKETLICTWVGETRRLWISPLGMYPKEVFLLDENEPDPSPAEGWAYARGFI